MAPGAPRGKRKVTRGGGKNFSKNLRPLDADGAGEGEGMWGDPRDPKPTVESSEEESSEEEEEEEEDLNKPDMTREERKAAEKTRKQAALAQKAASVPTPGDLPSDDEDEEEVREAPKKPVHGAGGIAVTNPNAAGVIESTLNRKEREAVEAAAAKERYWKLQEQGKTDQARADMARLAIIRQEREEKARQRKAEQEEKKAVSEEKIKGSGRKK